MSGQLSRLVEMLLRCSSSKPLMKCILSTGPTGWRCILAGTLRKLDVFVVLQAWLYHTHYLAIVMDLKTRQVVGWRLGLRHSSELTHEALLDALSKHPSPAILHSDQGSEYLSYKHQELCAKMEIQLSASNKASPWQNGFMERWFGGFKREMGNLA